MRASLEEKFLISTKREKAFISTGFNCWRDGTISFKKHQSKLCHREAVEAVISLPIEMSCGIGESLSNMCKQEKATNRKMFLTILHVFLSGEVKLKLIVTTLSYYFFELWFYPNSQHG